MPKTVSLKVIVIAIVALVSAQALILYLFGQPTICQCGYIKAWEGSVFSIGNSQHITDWYTPSHIIHGILFFALFSWLFPQWKLSQKLLAALTLEISWELLENTPMVINHYREQALAQGYTGDSILNSLSDSLAMVIGFFAAAKLPVWAAIAIILGFEILTISLIRDGLLLNVINLIYPIQFINTWQAAL